jgi:hypothetical protein
LRREEAEGKLIAPAQTRPRGGFYYCIVKHDGERLDLKTAKALAAHIVKEHPMWAERMIADVAEMFKFQQEMTDAWADDGAEP